MIFILFFISLNQPASFLWIFLHTKYIEDANAVDSFTLSLDFISVSIGQVAGCRFTSIYYLQLLHLALKLYKDKNKGRYHNKVDQQNQYQNNY
jgi:hypothetical protein